MSVRCEKWEECSEFCSAKAPHEKQIACPFGRCGKREDEGIFCTCIPISVTEED